MRQGQIIKAYNVLLPMMDLKLPYYTAHELYKLFCQIEKCYMAELELERELVKRFNGEMSSDGSIVFSSEDAADAFREEITAINSSEVEPDFSPVKIKHEDMQTIFISPRDIACLEGLIILE